MPTPIKLTLYDKHTQEPIKEVSQNIITFDMLIRASQLNELLENPPEPERKWWWIWLDGLPWTKVKKKSQEERQVYALMELVVDFFGNQFTLDELRDGTDVGEVIAVLRAIMRRANGVMEANPTKPPKNRRR